MIVIAHRGFSSRFLENTMPAIRAAIELGVDMVEIDVQQTRDRELVVFHDYGLERIYDVRQRVRDVLRKDLPHAPTLDQVLQLNFPLLIEIKGADPELISAAVAERKDVIVFSIHAAKIARLSPGIQKFGLFARRISFPPGVSGLGLSRRLVTGPAIVERIHRRGLKLFVWTVNRAEEMETFVSWGVDGLITDYPDRALQL
jgi:glycerophosphoryl diester phosphodiesterase